MKKLTTLLVVCLLGISSLWAQDPAASAWKRGGVGGLTFTNTGFSNYWQGGGVNSFAIGTLGSVYANLNKGKSTWTNKLDMAYGVIKQGDIRRNPFIKNEDRIEFNSQYGYKLTNNLLASSLLNFRSQFDAGFEYPQPGVFSVRNYISRFIAPGYINYGVGLEYRPVADDPNIGVYFSPLNAKITLVQDTNLSTRYMPAEFHGKKARFELGANLVAKYRKQLMKNVVYQTQATFFTNYLKNFGNVDVNWDNLLSLQVNKYINTTFATSLIYDDDIKFGLVEDTNDDGVTEPVLVNGIQKTGPRTQFKHVLSVGFVYKFEAKPKE